MNKKNILITGASGLIGMRLTEMLLQKGHQVSHLGRNVKKGAVPSFVWHVEQGMLDPKALSTADTVVHLAGAGIADKRWTNERKKEILESRTKSTNLLFKELAARPNTVRSFISASAIGYYGFDLGDETFTETSRPGTDFLARVTQQWEEEIDTLQELPLRVAKLRIGIVLSEKGGALKPMLVPIKLFVGSPLASGKQMMSWIHLDDLCAMFIHLIENDHLSGAFNGTAPLPVSNRKFTETVAKVLHRPLWLPNVPAFALRLLLGEMADLVIRGGNVSSQKIQQSGFVFQFANLREALQHLLTHQRN